MSVISVNPNSSWWVHRDGTTYFKNGQIVTCKTDDYFDQARGVWYKRQIPDFDFAVNQSNPHPFVVRHIDGDPIQEYPDYIKKFLDAG